MSLPVSGQIDCEELGTRHKQMYLHSFQEVLWISYKNYAAFLLINLTMLGKFKFKEELRLPTLFLTIPLFSSPYCDIPVPFNFILSLFDFLHSRLFLSFVTHYRQL